MTTPAAIAALAYAEILASKPRTARRRAAVAVYYSATVPPAKSVDAIRDVIGTFSNDAVQAAALELLAQLTAVEPPHDDHHVQPEGDHHVHRVHP